ncbi:MAG: hypothetical protein RSB71_00400 [Bacilli bacterium]
MTRFFFFLIGFGLTLIGWVYIISYLNLTTIGYNFLEYVNFISGQLECWMAIIGLVIIFISIPKEGKNELYLRYFNKL